MPDIKDKLFKLRCPKTGRIFTVHFKFLVDDNEYIVAAQNNTCDEYCADRDCQTCMRNANRNFVGKPVTLGNKIIEPKL